MTVIRKSNSKCDSDNNSKSSSDNNSNSYIHCDNHDENRGNNDDDDDDDVISYLHTRDKVHFYRHYFSKNIDH